MDLRSLRYFVSAVREGSISGASLKCHVAQPSITLAITKLEEEFGCQLLHRHRKGVSTTEKGLEFFQMALQLLQHADSLESKFKSTQETLKIKLAIHKSVQARYVEHVIRATQALALPIEFVISENQETADMALLPKHLSAAKSIFYPIGTEQYCVLLPTSNHLAHRPSLRLMDLAGQSLIERSFCENRALFDEVIKHYDLDLPVAARVDNEEWALALVAAGLGISISPLPIGFKDPRFVIRKLDELMDMETPERQIGLSFEKSISSEKQQILDEIGCFLTKGNLALATH